MREMFHNSGQPFVDEGLIGRPWNPEDMVPLIDDPIPTIYPIDAGTNGGTITKDVQINTDISLNIDGATVTHMIEPYIVSLLD